MNRSAFTKILDQHRWNHRPQSGGGHRISSLNAQEGGEDRTLFLVEDEESWLVRGSGGDERDGDEHEDDHDEHDEHEHEPDPADFDEAELDPDADPDVGGDCTGDPTSTDSTAPGSGGDRKRRGTPVFLFVPKQSSRPAANRPNCLRGWPSNKTDAPPFPRRRGRRRRRGSARTRPRSGRKTGRRSWACWACCCRPWRAHRSV